jgi:hypothetical protein
MNWNVLFQLEKIESLVKDAVKKGAVVLHGGKRNSKLRGLYYEPTLIVNIKPNMRLVQEEVCTKKTIKNALYKQLNKYILFKSIRFLGHWYPSLCSIMRMN